MCVWWTWVWVKKWAARQVNFSPFHEAHFEVILFLTHSHGNKRARLLSPKVSTAFGWCFCPKFDPCSTHWLKLEQPRHVTHTLFANQQLMGGWDLKPRMQLEQKLLLGAVNQAGTPDNSHCLPSLLLESVLAFRLFDSVHF